MPRPFKGRIALDIRNSEADREAFNFSGGAIEKVTFDTRPIATGEWQ